MIARRTAALIASVVGVFWLLTVPASAGDYPPAGVDDTEVGGVKTGVLDTVGLANTGGNLSVLWIGLAVLAVGVALLVTTRRRRSTHDDA
jgi:LPXTG-motif cell wall-anchored protein